MVAAPRVEKDTVFCDRDLTGFGARIYASGAKVCVPQARGPKRITMSRDGLINVDEARRRAALIIARIKGAEVQEPLAAKHANQLMVACLAAWYMRSMWR